ncbi:MAG: NAD(P)H-dependent oxidoreductase subunit E [Planctomycetota bacterium]|jgi:formate dehydrogenase/NADH-quinone oxidoreductase subunit F
MNLIEELYALQEAHGYLREPDLRELSRRLKVPLYELEGVSTFYPHFRRDPPPRLHVTACRDVSCHMRGSAAPELGKLCAGSEGVEFHEVSCLGRCDAAPACTVNDVPVHPGDVAGYLEDPSSLPADEPTAAPRRWKCDPYPTESDRYGVLRDVLREPCDLDGMIKRIQDSGLRGMGGAGFPTGFKWELVRKEPATPKYVICNADESEPGTFKDRVILEELPHLVLEGLILGALAIGAHEGWVYIRHEYTRECKAIRRAIQAAYEAGVLGESVCGSGFRLDIRVFVSPGGYILGEETALIEALEGKRGEPRNKPPYPGTHGLHGQPTLVNNVESLALVPYILRTGKQDLKFFSVSGDVNTPGVHEAAAGTTLNQLVGMCGGMSNGEKLQAFLPGGASTEFLFSEHADIVMDWKPLQEAGSALGAGAVVVVGESRDMLDLARNLTAFFRNESCGKCVPCRIGTQKAVAMIEGRSNLDLMPALHETLLETSICGLGQAALNPVLSVLKRVSR